MIEGKLLTERFEEKQWASKHLHTIFINMFRGKVKQKQ